MNLRARSLTLGLLLLVAGAALLAFALTRERNQAPPAAAPQAEAESLGPVPTPSPSPAASTPISAPTPASASLTATSAFPYQGLSDPRWPLRRKLQEEDPQYEWRTPISFYGKVVDQDGAPISGVLARLSWTDLSPKGTSLANRTTDAQGLFSITGITGKRLGVGDLEKEGYVAARGTNPYTFEYPGFWEPSYHIPDPANPVVFRMRKKRPPANLTAISGKGVVDFGVPFPIPLPLSEDSGSPAGTAPPLSVTVFESRVPPPIWRAQIRVAEGGLLPANDAYPFEAPEGGYVATVDLVHESPRPPGWQRIDNGGWFYLKTPKGYGLLEIRQMAGKRTLHYRVWMNPEGGRDLEQDSLSPP